jgi:hypothetical protein
MWTNELESVDVKRERQREIEDTSLFLNDIFQLVRQHTSH